MLPSLHFERLQLQVGYKLKIFLVIFPLVLMALYPYLLSSRIFLHCDRTLALTTLMTFDVREYHACLPLRGRFFGTLEFFKNDISAINIIELGAFRRFHNLRISIALAMELNYCCTFITSYFIAKF